MPIGTYYCSLVKRREKWAEQKKEEEKRKPDPDCPKGHKRVPEEERRKVLEKLKKCEFIGKTNFTQIISSFTFVEKNYFFFYQNLHPRSTVAYLLVRVGYSVWSLLGHKCIELLGLFFSFSSKGIRR